MKKGLFISFEGCEGSGKSTLASTVYSRLQDEGRKAFLTREPGGTPLGEKIRSLLLHDEEIDSIDSRAELLLFLASRAQHVAEVIQPRVDEGYVVISDRYIDSTVAYQGYGRAKDAHHIYRLSTQCVPTLPDLTICLDIPYEVAQARLKNRQGAYRDRMEKESELFHERVRKGFLELASLHSDRIVLMNGALPLNQLVDQALHLINQRMNVV